LCKATLEPGSTVSAAHEDVASTTCPGFTFMKSLYKQVTNTACLYERMQYAFVCSEDKPFTAQWLPCGPPAFIFKNSAFLPARSICIIKITQ
jgi:hypothetical protein